MPRIPRLDDKKVTKNKAGRKITCTCGYCKKCKTRERVRLFRERNKWNSLRKTS